MADFASGASGGVVAVRITLRWMAVTGGFCCGSGLYCEGGGVVGRAVAVVCLRSQVQSVYRHSGVCRFHCRQMAVRLHVLRLGRLQRWQNPGGHGSARQATKDQHHHQHEIEAATHGRNDTAAGAEGLGEWTLPPRISSACGNLSLRANGVADFWQFGLRCRDAFSAFPSPCGALA